MKQRLVILLITIMGLGFSQVGINTETPEQMLHINGKLKVGNDTLDATNGAVRFVDDKLQLFTDKWQTLAITKENTREEPEVINDVSYGAHARQKYNIYLPTEVNENTRVIVFLHGGGMVSGGKDEPQYVAVFERFIELIPDAVIITSNYRYKGNGVYVTPHINDDIQAMLRHSRSEFDLPNNYFLTGISAGGVLSFHAAFRGAFPIKAIAPIAAPWDYTHESVANVPDLPGAVANTVSPDIDKRGMSEALYASPKTFSKRFPILAIMGRNDRLIPFGHVDAIKEGNFNNPFFEYHVYNSNHTAFIHSPPFRTIFINKINAFTQKYK